ncbi:MAG: peptide ABC transporter substrate-binding protein [Chloroflexi bacterium]|nr:peptide ABC transporter substrate-binding protein [Chloroflexota bacterium]
MKTPRRVSPLLLLALGLLFSLGCALTDLASAPEGTPASAPPPGGAATQAPNRPAATPTRAGAATRPAATPTGPRAPDSLLLPFVGGDPPTLDPAVAQDATSAEVIVEIYGGLVTIDKDLKIVPDLAESWTLSDDKKTYTFKLRADAKFHNGRAVTAQDFKYSLERAADSKTESPVADSYLGDIVGVKDKLNRKATEVRGVKAVDDRTLQITIDAPKSYFLAKLTYPTAFVVDKSNVDSGGKTWFLKPNGTGPYKLAKYDFGQQIVLERNDIFYGTPKPSVKTVTLSISGGSFMTRYENGELDSTPVSIIDIDRVLDPANALNKELTVAPQFSISYIGFNVEKPPFDDLKVRQAFNMAIDKKTIAEVVLKKTSQPAKGILPPRFPGFNDNLKGLDYDPDKAKQLIKESKYGDPSKLPEITLNISGGGGGAGPMTEAIVEMIKQNIGVEVNIQQQEFASFLQDLNKRPTPFQMYSIGWIADYPDPQDFLDILFHGQSLDNHMSYANPEVDKLLEQAQVETDEKKRISLYQQAEQMLVTDAVWIPLFVGDDYWLTKPYVKGLIYPPFVIPRLKYATISR